jgi:hypothetical protein
MALKFIDSFDHYDEADDKYTQGGGTIIDAGRHGKGIQGPDSEIAFPIIESNKVIMGAAIKFLGFGGSAVFTIGNGNSTNNIELDALGDGTLRAAVFGEDDEWLTPADTIKINQWYFIEWVVEIVDGLTGTIKVYVDDELVINKTNVRTFPNFVVYQAGFGTYGWNNVSIGGNGTALAADDFYVCDGSGSAPFNDRLGDIEIVVLRPNAVTVQADWTPSPTVDNYLNVDDTEPDDDTTYNYTDTPGDIDLFEMDDLPDGYQVLGAQLLINARRTEEGFASLTPQLKQDGVIYDGATRPLASTYYYRNRDVYEKAPDGTDWTLEKINAIQAGYKRET